MFKDTEFQLLHHYQHRHGISNCPSDECKCWRYEDRSANRILSTQKNNLSQWWVWGVDEPRAYYIQSEATGERKEQISGINTYGRESRKVVPWTYLRAGRDTDIEKGFVKKWKEIGMNWESSIEITMCKIEVANITDQPGALWDLRKVAGGREVSRGKGHMATDG